MGRKQPRFVEALLAAALSFTALGATLPAAAQTPAQNQQHVVSVEELNQDAARPAQTRQADEAAVRDLLQTAEGQEALRRAKVDYERVDKAIGQLSDEDLTRIAARSRQAQSDFAAGGLGATLLIVVILIIVLAIVLSLVF
jgi:CHASE3 domain sensor protein